MARHLFVIRCRASPWEPSGSGECQNKTAMRWRAPPLNPLNLSSVKTPEPGSTARTISRVNVAQSFFELDFFQKSRLRGVPTVHLWTLIFGCCFSRYPPLFFEMAGVGIRWHASIEQPSVQCVAGFTFSQGVCEELLPRRALSRRALSSGTMSGDVGGGRSDM